MTRWERVYFDLDNTLFDYEKAFELASKNLFHSLYPTIPIDQWFHAFKQACDRYWHDYEQGDLSRGSYQVTRFQQSLVPFAVNITAEEALDFEDGFKETIPDFIELFDGVEPLLSYLTSRYIEIGIISNGSTHQQMEKMNAVSLFDWIPPENIYVSDQKGKMKPSDYLFNRVIAKSTGNPAESLYIGDAWDLDITAALTAGWNVIYLNRTKRNPPADEHLFYTTKEFKELYEKRNKLFNLR